MDVNALKSMSGSDLDAAGDEAKLDRVSKAGGHAFDETDDSYRRRLLASIVGAAAADAMSQPADIEVESTDRKDDEPPKAPETPKLKQDGPTVEEWVIAGYDAEHYPPHGYASKSSAEEIAAAVAAQKAAKAHVQVDENTVDADVDAGSSATKLP